MRTGERVAWGFIVLLVAVCLVFTGATWARLGHECPVTYVYPGGMD